MLEVVIAQTRKECEASLHEPGLQRVAGALERNGTTPADCVTLVRALAETGDQQPARRLKASLQGFGIDVADGSVERFLLLHGALWALDSVPLLPVALPVKERFYDAFQRLAHPSDRNRKWFRTGHSHFAILCKVASLCRFPAGDFDWELSGFPRSWLFRVEARSLPRVLYMLAVKFKGFSPAFVPHVGISRNRRSLSELEYYRSLYRMARSLELQPRVKGCVASSWLRSPDTIRVSPHLAWINRVCAEHGAVITRMGPADPKCGVLSRSGTRKRLYESGEFIPTTGLMIWPRKEMLRWALAHPEFGD